MGAVNTKRTRRKALKPPKKDYSILIEAIKDGEVETVKTWIEQNPKMVRRAIDSDGWTPLHHACHESQMEMVKFLLETDLKWGLDLENTSAPAYNLRDKAGLSPIFRTSLTDIIELLLDKEDLEVFDAGGYLLDYLMDGLENAIRTGNMEKVTTWISRHPNILR